VKILKVNFYFLSGFVAPFLIISSLFILKFTAQLKFIPLF